MDFISFAFSIAKNVNAILGICGWGLKLLGYLKNVH